MRNFHFKFNALFTFLMKYCYLLIYLTYDDDECLKRKFHLTKKIGRITFLFKVNIFTILEKGKAPGPP